MEYLAMSENRKLTWGLVWGLVALLILMLFAAPQTAVLKLRNHALALHIGLEFWGIMASFGVFILGWFAQRRVGSGTILFLSLIGLSVGLLDFAHTLSFPGMPDFVTPSDPNKSIYFRLAGRFTHSFALLYVAKSYHQNFDFQRLRYPLVLVSLAWVCLWYVLVLGYCDHLPIMYIKESGPTNLKGFIDFLTFSMSVVAAILFVRRSASAGFDYYRQHTAHLLACSSFIFALAGVFFMFNRPIDDLYFFSGHVFKLVAFTFLFKAVFFKCVIRPYNEAKRLAKEAEIANLAKSRFLANVSHELRTPLGVISGFSNLLKRRVGNSESVKMIDAIEGNTDQLKFLIDDLLDFTKLEVDVLSVHKEPFDLKVLVENVVEGLRVMARKKQIEIVVNFDESIAQNVNSDSHRLRQILLNVIGNAIKFSQDGMIKVEVTKQDTRIFRISVQDDGIGIDPKKVSDLFKPFTQLDDSAARTFGGSGLGLALSRKISHLLGGDLWLESSSPNQGSLFVFTFVDDAEVHSS
jgi:two-component system, NarL family, sensor histidine kinase BarA